MDYLPNDCRITGVEIFGVGVESTTARYSGRHEPEKEVNTILRITTADGVEGVSGVDSCFPGGFSDQHLRALEGVAADLFALQSLKPDEVGVSLRESHPDLSDPVRSSIDIALWDLAARRANLPLYKMLGATRDSMEAYASLPFYESLPEYVEAVNQCAKLGFRTFKFHVWGEIDRDIRLIELVQQTYSGSDYRFMIDLEGAYGLEDSLTLGKRMEEGPFVWLEAPMDDADLAGYAELRNQLAIPIVPGGNTFHSPEFISQGIEARAWDAARFGVTRVGGISQALQLLKIANDADLPVEIQSWGHSLAQAANLHVALANERTRYFEAPVPVEAFEFGVKSGISFDGTRAVAPEGPGLGIEVEWERLDSADFIVMRQLADG